MTISIVTISKDDPNGLNKTLSSTQGLHDVEQIVVLGGGDLQPSIKVSEQFHCVLVCQAGQGISAAFNLGLDHATGLAVIFLNGGDCLLEPGVIGHALEIMVCNPAVDILLYDAIFDDALAGPYLYRSRRGSGPRLNTIGLGMPGSHQATIVRRSSFAQIGRFCPDYQVAMDYDWLCRWHQNSASDRRICAVDFPPIVTVDGKGISVAREPLCLQECFLALHRNNLFKGRYALDYLNRLSRFYLRNALIMLKLNGLVARVKQWKHR